MRLLALFCTLMMLIGGCAYLNRELHFKDDHFAEEITELIIYEKIGVDLDLTPGSPEE